VELRRQELFVRHRVQVAVQAVDHDDACLVLLDRMSYQVGEFAGRKFSGIDLLDANLAPFQPLLELDA
jgi:hypothetical protein